MSKDNTESKSEASSVFQSIYEKLYFEYFENNFVKASVVMGVILTNIVFYVFNVPFGINFKSKKPLKDKGSSNRKDDDDSGGDDNEDGHDSGYDSKDNNDDDKGDPPPSDPRPRSSSRGRQANRKINFTIEEADLVEDEPVEPDATDTNVRGEEARDIYRTPRRSTHARERASSRSRQASSRKSYEEEDEEEEAPQESVVAESRNELTSDAPYVRTSNLQRSSSRGRNGGERIGESTRINDTVSSSIDHNGFLDQSPSPLGFGGDSFESITQDAEGGGEASEIFEDDFEVDEDPNSFQDHNPN